MSDSRSLSTASSSAPSGVIVAVLETFNAVTSAASAANEDSGNNLWWPLVTRSNCRPSQKMSRFTSSSTGRACASKGCVSARRRASLSTMRVSSTARACGAHHPFSSALEANGDVPGGTSAHFSTRVSNSDAGVVAMSQIVSLLSLLVCLGRAA